MEGLFIASLLIVISMISTTNLQYLPPGVNPNTYNDPPVQQEQQQQSQTQFQRDHVPAQRMSSDQQTPHQTPHTHSHSIEIDKTKLAEEGEHIQKHLHVNVDLSKMTPSELHFHYFKMYDTDNNNKLDGTEILKTMIHWHGFYGFVFHTGCIKGEFEKRTQSTKEFKCRNCKANFLTQ